MPPFPLELRLHYYWRYLQDSPAAPVHYAVSPWFGFLIKSDTATAIPHLGMSTGANAVDAFPDPARIGDVSGATMRNRRQGFLTRCAVQIALKALPLYCAIKVTGFLSPARAPFKRDALAEDLDVMARHFGHRSKGNCLEMALCRFSLARRLGLMNCCIVVGVFTPTDEMHAWIEINGTPVLECLDFLAHYQASVKYYDNRFISY